MLPRNYPPHSGPRRGVLAAALLAAVPGVALSVPVDYEVGLSALHSDNLGMVETDPKPDTVLMPDLRFGIEQSGSTLSLRAGGVVQYVDYVDDTFDDGFRGALSAQALWTLIPDRLQWTFEDYLSLQPIDSLAAFSPDNQQQANLFVTGPTLLLRAGNATHGQVDMRYIRSYAQDNETFNGNRLGIAARLFHDFSTTSTLSANVEAVDVKYDVLAPESEYTRYDAYGRYWRQLRDLETNIDLGYSVIKYGGVRKDESLPLARFSVNWQASPRSAVNLRLNYEFSDAAQNLIIDGFGTDGIGTEGIDTADIDDATGNPSVPIGAGIYRQRGVQLGYQFTGGRLSFEVRPYYLRLDYLQLSAQNEEDWGGYGALSYKIRPRLDLQLAAAIADRKFEGPVRKYRDTTASIALENSFTAHWVGRVELQRRERDSPIIGQDYKENVAILSFTYRR